MFTHGKFRGQNPAAKVGLAEHGPEHGITQAFGGGVDQAARFRRRERLWSWDATRLARWAACGEMLAARHVGDSPIGCSRNNRAGGANGQLSLAMPLPPRRLPAAGRAITA